MRNFERFSIHSACALLIGDQVIKTAMVNFSRMGAAIRTGFRLAPKKYVSLVYRNEKNETIRMLTYVVHSTAEGDGYVIGLQFVGIEGRS